jgi:hypothetical protein
MNQDRLKEGWVDFTRYYCKSGWIDRWTGDSINDPNRPTKSNWQLNSFAQFWRFDGGGWISDYDLGGKSKVYPYLDIRQDFTSVEILQQLLNDIK